MTQYIQRGLFAEAESNLSTFPVLKIQGARQVGKSTLARLLMDNRESIYKSLDRETLREQAEEDPELFVEAPSRTTVVIDEVQRVPKVSLAVKHNVDENRQPGRYILTGSSDFTRAVGPKDSLAGRAVSIRLFPLSLAERAGTLSTGTFIDRYLSGDIRSGLKPQAFSDRDEFAQLIARGGYPSVQGLGTKHRQQWFRSYINDVVGLDVLDQKLTPHPGRLQTVLRLLAAQQSQELVRATLARESQIPESSMPGYIDILERSYLLNLVQPWSRNIVERQKGKPKILLNDTGLAAFLAQHSPERWLDPENPDPSFGRAVESAIMQELLSQQGWADNFYTVFHWRDRSGREVDAICELDDGSVIVFEVKSGPPRSKHFSSLHFLKERLGDKFRAGFVVSSTDSVQEWTRGMYSIPWSLLWS